MRGKIKDYDKLMVIAQTYFFLKGSFTTAQLYDFIVSNDFKFHSGVTKQGIGINLSRSSKFKKSEDFPPKYEVI